MKGKTTLRLIGRTIEKSGQKKDGKYAYLFVDADQKTDNGLYIGKDAYTYWTPEDFANAMFGDPFDIEFETVGENIVIRSAKPVLKSAKA